MRKLLLLLFSVMTLPAGLLAQGPGCPNVNAGNDQTLPCNTNCTTLNATMFQTGATTTYTVSSIPYNPPAPSTAWTNTFVNIDDIWSGVINLPFTFCYYGTNYTQLVVGANGVISFNTAYANQFCPWSYTATVPSPALPLNAIFGAYHDIDPSVCGTIRYAISGTFPCRTFMFDFDNVCHYQCNQSRHTSQRIVLYETSNVIEVYIGNKETCTGWNGGRAVIGIQNAAGDLGITPATRQTGAWSASNEGWRFTPSGAPNYQLNWYSSASPGVIGTTPSINVCPTNQFTTYSAILTYTNCNGAQVVVSDYVNVSLSGPAQPPIWNNAPICAGNTLLLSTQSVAGATYVWSGPGGWTSNAQNPTRAGATTAMSGTYTLYVVVAGCTSSVASQTITILNNSVPPNFTTNSPICSGTTLMLNGPTMPGVSYFWSGPGGWTSNIEDPSRANATAAMSGVYSLYVVTGGCTSATATQNVVINSAPAAPAISSNSPVCTPNSINLFGPTVAGATYLWSGPGGWTSNVEDPTRPNANTSMGGTYSLSIVVAGCTSAVSNTNVVVNGPPIPVVNIPQQICEGQTANFYSGTYPGATYVWSGPNGFTASVESPVLNNASTANTGTYTLYLVQSGCTSVTASSYMEVVSTVAPNIASNSPVCVGGTINLTSNTIVGATYNWSGPNGFSSTQEDPSITGATAAHAGTYSMYAVVSGCSSTTATTNVQVNPVPTVNAVGNQTVCAGSPTTTVSFSGSVGGATYNWTNSNPAIGLAASGNGNILSFTATNATAAPITGTITVTPVAAGCTGTPTSFTITVNPGPTVNAVPNQTVCNGASTTAVNFSGTVAGTTFAWTNSNPAIGLAASGNGNIGAFNAVNAGTAPVTATITVTPTANGCPGTPASFTITVNPTPTVNAVGNQTVCAGSSTAAVNFAGAVTGTTFAWTNSNPAVGLGASGNGNIGSFSATNATSAPITATVTVTPTANGCPGTPTSFTITVNPTPTVTAIANQTVCNGAPTTAVNIIGPVAGSTFTWTNSNPAIGLGASGNGNIGSFNAVNAGTTPVTATVTVTPTANGCPGTPASFTITVNPTPTVNAVGNQTVCNGASTTAVNFGGTVAGTSYSWTNSNPAIGLGASGNGNIAAFTATNATAAPITGTVTVTPTANGCPGTPTSFTITVNPTPAANNVPDQTVCNGASTTAVNFGSSTTGTTYSWTNNTPSIGLGASGNGDIAAFNAVNAGTAPVTATITATPNANGCNGPVETFTITVNPTPSINNVPDQTLCNGAATTAVNFAGPVAGTTYSWTNSDPSIGLGASGNGNIGSFNAVNAGTAPVTATITATPTANGCTGPVETFTITVNPTPSVTNVPDQTLCAGAATTAVNFAGPVAGTTYSWTNSDPTIGLGASGNGNIASFNAVNAGTAPVTATVTVTPTANTCTGPVETFTITVNPSPTANNVPDQTVCNGASTAAVNFGSSTAGTTFSWTNSDPSIGLGASGNGNIGSFNAVNAGTAPVTATVTVTPTANGCNGPVETFTITVNPTPSVNNVTDQTLCNGVATTAVNFAGPVAGTTYAWTNSDPTIGLGASGNGNIASFNAVNAGTAPVTATVAVTPTANTCTGPVETFTITVNPTPSVNNVTDQTLCNGAATTAITLAGPVAGTTFAWTNSDPSIGLGASGNGNIASFNAVNAGTAPVTATVTVTPTANTCTGPVETFTITVNPTPSVNNVTDQTLCNGAATTAVNFAGPVTGTTYAWTNSDPSIGLGASGNGNIASFNAVNAGTAPVTATVTVTPTANTCTGPVETFTITVNPTPSVNNVTDQTVCNGAATTAITLAGPVTGTTFAWTNSDASIGLAASGTGTNIASFNAVNAGTAPVTATVTVTPTANTCTGPVETFTITVNPTPTANNINNQTVCNGAATTAVAFAGPVAGTTFAWTNSDATIGLGASGNGNIAAFNGVNAGTAPVTATVTVTPTANGCTGPTNSFSITVNPAPTVNVVANQTLCNGDNSTAVTFGSPVAGTTYAWTNSNTLIGLPANGTGNIASFAATNIGSIPLSGTITVTPTANGCTGPNRTFTITVNPTFTGSQNATICNGDTYTFGTQSFTVAGTYPVLFQSVNGCDSTVTLNLTVNPTYSSTLSQTICQGDSVVFGGTVYNSTGNYPVTFQTVNGCDSIVTLNLTVTPTPVVTIAPQADQCIGVNSFDFSTVQNFPAGTLFNWTFAGSNTPASTAAAPQDVVYPGPATYQATVTVNVSGCTNSDTLSVTVLPEPTVQFNALPPTGCVPLTVSFTNLSPGGGTPSWNFGDGNTSTDPSPTHVYTTPGVYNVSLTVTGANGCSATQTVTGLINVQAIPTAGFSAHPSEVAMDNPLVFFSDGSTGSSGVFYYIQGANPLPGPNAQYNFLAEGTYEVMQVVNSGGGCTDTAYATVIVHGTTEVYIPNAFSPNNDPFNPGFRVVGNNFSEFHMMIFNRWGELLFESYDPDMKWDGTYGGKLCPVDVYVCKIEFLDYKKDRKLHIGSVTLLR